MGRMQWWIITFLAALILLGSAAAFLWTRVPSRPLAQAPARPRVRCANLDVAIPRLLPDAEATPLLLWGAGKVRLFVDAEPVFSAPDAPRSFLPGEHLLRAEVEGTPPT